MNELGEEADDEIFMAVALAGAGFTLIPNSEHDGFKYEVFFNSVLLELYGMSDYRFFISDIPTSDLQDTSSSINILVLGNSPNWSLTRRLPFIYAINQDIDYIAWYDLHQAIEEGPSVNVPIVFTKELEHDDEGYLYEGFVMTEILSPAKLFTPVEYTKSSEVVVILSLGSTGETATLQMTVQANKESVMPDEVKEFVFNVKSPANIVLSHPVSWNNSNTPDFAKSGTYTLSILNGVGCYTFT